MSDVLISYSRKDVRFVRRLHAALTERGRVVWVDWDKIPPTAGWREEITRAIDAAGVFVFVISPDSIASEVCRAELAVAVGVGKRIIPVLHRDITTQQAPPGIDGINWLFLRPDDDLREGADALLHAVDLDLEWLRFHARLLTRAAEWHEHRGDDSYLLAGSDLERAQRLLATATDRQPPVTPLQTAYVAESQAGDSARQRAQARGMYLASLVFGVLQAGAVYALAFDGIDETALKVLAPTWIFALAFGGWGMLMSRPTPAKSALSALVVVVLLTAVYLVIPLV